jgi:hypothetical protein
LLLLLLGETELLLCHLLTGKLECLCSLHVLHLGRASHEVIGLQLLLRRDHAHINILLMSCCYLLLLLLQSVNLLLKSKLFHCGISCQ